MIAAGGEPIAPDRMGPGDVGDRLPCTIVSSTGHTDDERDWLSELSRTTIGDPIREPGAGGLPTPAGSAEGQGPGGAAAPGRSVISEIAALRLEVSALRSLFAEPKDDGAKMLTASALIELQAEVREVREALQALNAVAAEPDDSLVRLQQSVQTQGTDIERAVAALSDRLRHELDEHEAKLGGAIVRVAKEVAELRAALFG
jgi:hypothetical protein